MDHKKLIDILRFRESCLVTWRSRSCLSFASAARVIS